jgi:hypothetical protein
VAAQGGEASQPAELRDVVDALLAGLVGTVPSPLHLRALEACAQVLTTTEPLRAELLDLLDDRAFGVGGDGSALILLHQQGGQTGEGQRQCQEHEISADTERAEQDSAEC